MEIQTIIIGLLALLFIWSIVGFLSKGYPYAKGDEKVIDDTCLSFEKEPSFEEEAQKHHDEVLVPRFDKQLKAAKRKYPAEMRKFKRNQEKPPIKEMDKVVAIIDTEHGKLIRCGKDAVLTKHIASIKSLPGSEPRLYEGRIDEPSWISTRYNTPEKSFNSKRDYYGYSSDYGSLYNKPKVIDGDKANITIESVSGKEFTIKLPQYLADHAFDMVMKTWKGNPDN